MKPTHTSAGNSVLITGCSTGIGYHCAMDFAQQGWTVFAGVRSVADAQKIARGAQGDLRPIQLDIADPASIAAATELLRDAVGGLGLRALVNNAGVLVAGPLELISMSQFRSQFEVNVFGTQAITQAVLPLLKVAQAPRIAFIGSISGRITPPFYGAYAASKHALESLADAWRMELRQQAIRVSIIEPDRVATPLWDKSSSGLNELRQTDSGNHPSRETTQQLRSARRHGLANRQSGMPTAKVVAAVRHALTAARPRTHYPVGLRTRAAFLAQAILPTHLMDMVLRKAIGH